MGFILQAFAALYTVLLWVAIVLAMMQGTPVGGQSPHPLAYVAFGVVATLPGVALFAFGQVVRHTRQMRDSLDEMLELLRGR